MRTVSTILLIAAAVTTSTHAQTVVAMPGKSPLVNFRLVFRTGAASDAAGKPGAASLTAAMLAEGGTKELTRKQVLDALFPMASSVSWSVDKEMTVFSGTTHIDNLDAYYTLFRDLILNPGWREEDLKRLKDDAVNYLRVSLRDNNDEELGKEVLYNEIYSGHPYGHHNYGTVSSIQKLTLEDLKGFYSKNYTEANLTIGVAGGFPAGFDARVKKDFAARLREGDPKTVLAKIPTPKPIAETRVVIVKKAARFVAYSLGFPIDVKRGHPDYPALLMAQSWLGQHRSSGGRLFERMRQIRGLNYGDYAYIEHFPGGMYRFEPEPNIARQQQIFQVWIRPVEVPTAHFALRLAMFEMDRLVREGITGEQFAEARNFLVKNGNLLTRTRSAELGYAIDSRFYGIEDYNTYLRKALANLTVEDVNRAIRKHLRTDDMVIVAVAENAEELKKKLVSGEPSPMTYNSPKPEDILAEDKIVAGWKLPMKPENVRIVPGETVFE